MFRAAIFALIVFIIYAGSLMIACPYGFLLLLSTIGQIKGYKYLGDVFLGFDQLFNVVFQKPLMMIFDNPEYKFGKVDETISSVLGKNIKYYPETTHKSVYIVDKWLSKIDKTTKTNSIDAIEEDE